MPVVSLAERPDLIDSMWNMPSPWPTFMLHGRHSPVIAALHFALSGRHEQ